MFKNIKGKLYQNKCFFIVKLLPYNLAGGGHLKNDLEMYRFETI